MSGDFDELLQPTVAPAPREPRAKPWRVQSQFWVAFLGGILPVAAIALINARRLDVDRRKQWLMAAASVAAIAILFASWMQAPPAADFFAFVRGGRTMRIVGRVLAVVLFLVFAALQKPADARYSVFSKGGHASLWRAGIASTLVLGTVQTLLVAGLAWLVSR